MLYGEILISLKRFFASLRFTQNDNCLENWGKMVGSGKATSNHLPRSSPITCCHSERSEESLIFIRTPIILIVKFKGEKLHLIFVYFNQISVYFSFTISNYFPFFKLIPYFNPLSLHIA